VLAVAFCCPALLVVAAGVAVGAAEPVAAEGVSDAGGVSQPVLGGATAPVAVDEGLPKEAVGVGTAPRGTG
jgi:hypothetical protein